MEIRLDAAYREKLARLVEARGGTVSDVIRSLIDDCARQLDDREFRERIRSLQETAPDLPSWEELKDEIARGHCAGIPEFSDQPDLHAPVR